MSSAQKQRNVLPDHIKKFIVESLACYDTPGQVAKAVKEEFDLDVTRQQCAAYDPTKVAGQDLSQPWQDLFYSTRKSLLEDEATIGIAHRPVRLRKLERLLERAEADDNLSMCKTVLELIRKEVNDPPKIGAQHICRPQYVGDKRTEELRLRFGGKPKTSGSHNAAEHAKAN